MKHLVVTSWSAVDAEVVTLFNLEGTLRRTEREYSGELGGLAQLGERLICIQEVNGSIPLFSTTWARSSAG